MSNNENTTPRNKSHIIRNLIVIPFVMSVFLWIFFFVAENYLPTDEMGAWIRERSHFHSDEPTTTVTIDLPSEPAQITLTNQEAQNVPVRQTTASLIPTQTPAPTPSPTPQPTPIPPLIFFIVEPSDTLEVQEPLPTPTPSTQNQVPDIAMQNRNVNPVIPTGGTQNNVLRDRNGQVIN